MGLTRYALVFGLGYTLGRPDGRRRLSDLGQQTAALTRRPEIKRLQERGWDIAGDTLRAARKKLPATSRQADGDGVPVGHRLNRSWRRHASAETGAASAESSEDPMRPTPAPR